MKKQFNSSNIIYNSLIESVQSNFISSFHIELLGSEATQINSFEELKLNLKNIKIKQLKKSNYVFNIDCFLNVGSFHMIKLYGHGGDIDKYCITYFNQNIYICGHINTINIVLQMLVNNIVEMSEKELYKCINELLILK